MSEEKRKRKMSDDKISPRAARGVAYMLTQNLSGTQGVDAVKCSRANTALEDRDQMPPVCNPEELREVIDFLSKRLAEKSAVSYKLERDPDPMSPNEWENEDAFAVAFHPSMHVTRKGLQSAEDIESWKDEYHVLNLYAHIHSGIVVSANPYSDRWDSGQIGYILIRKDAKWTSTIPEIADSICEEWNTYLGGDVWGFIIQDALGNELESLWNIYTEEHAHKEAKETVKFYNERKGKG